MCHRAKFNKPKRARKDNNMNLDNTQITETDNMSAEDMEILANGINTIFGKPMALHGNIKNGSVHVTTKEFQGVYSLKQLKRLIEQNEVQFSFMYDYDAEENKPCLK